MFKNYLKIALRNLLKYRAYSFINIFGLAVGMASCILILLYVHDELGYDKYHEQAGQIYRVTREWFNSDGSSSLHLGHVAPPIGPLLKNDFPDLLHVVRLASGGNSLLRYQDKIFQESRGYFADPDIFEVFTLPLLKGDAKTALLDPNSIVLTPALAQKYFDNEDPIGKIINIDGDADLKVTAIMQEIPRGSHFHFDFLGSMKLLEQFFGEQEFKNWAATTTQLICSFPKIIRLNISPRPYPRSLAATIPRAKRRYRKRRCTCNT